MSIIGVLLILPGWFWVRRKTPQIPFVLGLPILGIVLWIGLTYMGIGAQSLSNIVETFIIFAVSISSAYVKFFIFDRSIKHRPYGNFYVFAVVILVTLWFRLFMPQLPE